MLHSNDLAFSFSGLKTAVLTAVKREGGSNVCDQARADIARGFVDAIVDVLAAKALRALEQTGLDTLVVAGGVGANRQLRERLGQETAARGATVYFPPPDLCTDNGAMIALAGLAGAAPRRCSAALARSPGVSPARIRAGLLAEADRLSVLAPVRAPCSAAILARSAAPCPPAGFEMLALVPVHDQAGDERRWRQEALIETPAERRVERREHRRGRATPARQSGRSPR